MSPVAVTFIRTVKASRALYHTAFSVSGFLAAAAVVWLFAGEFLLQIYLQGKLEH